MNDGTDKWMDGALLSSINNSWLMCDAEQAFKIHSCITQLKLDTDTLNSFSIVLGATYF